MSRHPIAQDLRDFAEDLITLTRGRLVEIGLDGSEDLAFVELLASERADRAGRHLQADLRSRRAVRQWLELDVELAREHLAEAEDVESVTDAALSALDSVHGYLLAHALVGPGYLEEEYRRCDELFPAFSDAARTWQEATTASGGRAPLSAHSESPALAERDVTPPLSA